MTKFEILKFDFNMDLNILDFEVRFEFSKYGKPTQTCLLQGTAKVALTFNEKRNKWYPKLETVKCLGVGVRECLDFLGANSLVVALNQFGLDFY